MASGATTYDLADCILMLHCDGADESTTFTDEAGHSVTANANAQIDTAQSVFGGASGKFDGSGDYLSLLDDSDWDIGTDDFTLDYRIRFAASGSYANHLSRGATDFRVISRSNEIGVVLNGQARYTQNPSFANDTWYHIAIVRSGTDMYVFINGTQLGSSVTAGDSIGGTSGLTLGGNNVGDLSGWMDEVRLCKGVAIWTSNFTAPSAAYTLAGAGAAARRVFLIT